MGAFVVVDGSALAQVLIDQDPSSPCVILWYHQVFMPVLQLVLVMLTLLGMEHTMENHQVGHTCHNWSLALY